jgi:nucleotide-binding universal stress UspA family protein
MAEPPFRRVLVATGRSSGARAAMQMAARLAGSTGGEVTLLCVADSPVPVVSPDPAATDLLEEQPDSAAQLAEQLAREDMAEAAADIGGDVACCTKLCWGPVGPAVVEEARTGRYDVVVVALRRRRDRLLREDAEHHVVHHSPIPVLVLPPD